ncbi:DUF808 domain-containing protein [Luteolibacter luteus]|uniref:DUF808 domain-containing protein n=1 Tax=Luteolibacter luteus TaxID=2728835 RepID=A0A858RMY5_9BACT|nr:DUF808 domain-containing protein [Luteolibacter luteus]QJE97844.1 DUF808 domain-containing protein [Luteolibacter luteus]
MAGGSLLTLLDDIASILDDVSVMTKTAASKTAGVLGDDLALNAQQVSGVVAKRELPVVWSVAKGSFVNKLILVPAALVISAFAPWLVSPLLMVGGLYLCFEGVEKLAHQFLHKHEKTPEEAKQDLTAPKEGELDEKAKIKGAVRTDFVLSAEIIAITLGVVATKPFPTQVMTLSLIAIIMTVGVYGLVAGIVKLDDLGLYLSQRGSAAAQGCGKAILWAAPFLMKLLSVLGTAAMFLVGGGIVTHGIPVVHHWIEHVGHGAGAVGGAIIPALLNGIFGVVAGSLVLLLVSGFKKLRGGKAH